METSFQKFFIEAKTDEEKKKIFSSTFLFISVNSVVLSAVIFFTAPIISKIITGNELNAYLFKILSLILIIDALSRFPMILINGLQNSKLFAVINGISVIVNVGANVIFIGFLKMGIEAIFYSYVISYSFLLILSYFFTRKYFNLKPDKQTLIDITKFAHPFLYYALFIYSIDLIDRFFLGYFKGESVVGVYAACYRIGIVMNLLISGFRTAWIPFFLNLKEEENNKEIFSKIFSYFCFGGLLLFLAVSLFVNDIAGLKIGDFTLLNKAYWGGLTIIPFVLMAYLFFGLYTNMNVASYFENKPKYLIISAGAGCVSNIILNFILIPPFSFMGAAIVTMLSYMIMFFVLYYFSQKIYYIKYEWNTIILISVLTFLLFFANFFISDVFIISYFAILLIKAVSVLILAFFIYSKKPVKLKNLIK